MAFHGIKQKSYGLYTQVSNINYLKTFYHDHVCHNVHRALPMYINISVMFYLQREEERKFFPKRMFKVRLKLDH